MKITRLQPQRGNSRRISVFVDGVYCLALDRDKVARLELAPGSEVEPEALERLAREDEVGRAKEYALLLLSYRARTVKELTGRLRRKGFGLEVADAVIARLRELRILDDSRFAADFAEARLKLAHKGKRIVRAELRKLGVEKQEIDAAIAQAPDETEAAAQLVEKLKSRYARLEPEVRRRRLYALLARRGFSPDTIRAVIGLVDGE